MSINKKQIRDYFQLLDPHSSYFSCIVLDSESKKALTGNLYEKVDTLIATLESLSGVNPTLHVTLNKCDDKGRNTKNVKATRVLCVDLDVVKTKEEIEEIVSEYRVHFVVRSSPGKYHLYWVCDGLPLETWQKYQRALAFKLGGDLNLDQLAKTIRVPGCTRRLKDLDVGLHNPELVFVDAKRIETEVVTVGSFTERWPWWELAEKDCVALKKKHNKSDDSSMRKYRDSGYTGTIKVKLGRNATLYRAINDACFKDGLSLEAARELAFKLNAGIDVASGGPLDESEVETIVESAHSGAERGLQAKTESNKKQLEHLSGLKDVPTNGITEPFIYDHSSGAMRDSRFSSAAVVEMVGQKYGKSIVRMGTVLYAFCPETLVWIPQKPTPTVVSDFSLVCTRDLFRDSKFKDEFNKPGDTAKFLSDSFISGVTKQVMLRRYSSKEGKDFDRAANLLFCSNGVVDLDTGRVRDAVPEDYLLRTSNVRFDPKARCPRWEKFIVEVFSENEDPEKMVEFLQDVFGYSLTGSISRMELYVHFGSGSNGKSKVLQAISDIMGDYGTMMAGTALAKSPKAFQKELERIGVKIEGKRCVIVDDLDTATQWNEGIIKNLTGKKIMARKLYEEERDIPNRAKFHIGCNEKPVPESENFAILRRLCLIPYNRQFDPSSEKEDELQDMLETEMSGILNWAIDGYRKGLERRLEKPPEVIWEIKAYEHQHFAVEGVVNELFSKPETKDETRENWHTVGDLVLYVNDHLAERGMTGKVTTPEKLGGTLKNKLHLRMAKLKRKGRVERGYYVLFNEPEKPKGLSQLQ